MLSGEQFTVGRHTSIIIGNPNFGNIDNLLSQACDMKYIVRHYTWIFPIFKTFNSHRSLTVNPYLPCLHRQAGAVNLSSYEKYYLSFCIEYQRFPDRGLLKVHETYNILSGKQQAT